MRVRFLAALAAAAFLLALWPAPAQAQLTRGAVSGTVFDQTGAAVPGATATVTNEDTGITRTGVSNEQGFYRVIALEPGPYRVRVEMPGFTTIEKRSIDVPMATEVPVSFDLRIQTAGEELTVTAEAGAIELNKSNPTVGITLKGRQAVELPLSVTRNINNLALLAPNTFSAPGSTGISANGSRARNNNFMIDGTDNNDISVTLSTTPVVPEAVAEFQNQTNAYNAEFGRSSGAQINVTTKSGTNSFHGEVWDYYRTAGLNALDNLEKASGLTVPPKSVRHQLGASLGGPLVKDKTFFFGLFQRDTVRTGDILGNSVRTITPAGYAALANLPLRAGQSQASRNAVLERLRFLEQVYALNPTFRTLQTTAVNGVPIETGLTNIGRRQPFESPYAQGRLDHQLTRNDSLTFRYILNSPESTSLISNCVFGTVFCGDQDVTEHNAAFSHTRVFSSMLLNELRVAFIKRDLQFPENDPTTPTTTIGGLFTIGGDSNFPQGRVQKSWQFSDVVSLTRGRHAFKFGADIRRIDLDNQAAFDSKGTYAFANLEAYMNNVATTFQQALQTSSFNAKQWQTFWFVQDDFRPTSDLVLNLGFRYEVSTVPLGFFGATEPQVLAALVPGPVKKDTNNWSPVVGFAWSPRKEGFFGSGRTVLRGGYRSTYDVLFYNILTVNASNYPRVVVPQVQNVIDQYPNVVPLSGNAVFNPLAGFVNSPEDLQNPKQHIYSMTMQREIGRDFIVELGYTGSTGRNGINQLQANYAVLTPEQAATVQSTLNPLSIPNVQARRLSPQFGSRTLIASTAKSQYHAGFLSVNKRMSHGIQFQASYTLSRFKSDNDESLGVAAITNSSPQIPQDFARIDEEYTLSVFDRPHRFVVHYIWEVPGPKSGFLKQVLNGWQISGITQMQSGQPFTIVTGVDTNGNGGGGDRPNLDPSGSITWNENGQGFTTDGRYVVPRGANGLPLLFSLGNGNAPRNHLRGAGFWRTDLSLSKRFEVGRHRLTLRADALNAFNQDEFGNPVANMNSPSFGTNILNWGNRSLTFGVKYGF